MCENDCGDFLGIDSFNPSTKLFLCSYENCMEEQTLGELLDEHGEEIVEEKK